MLQRAAAAAESAGLWESLSTDWLLLDAEILPATHSDLQAVEPLFVPTAAQYWLRDRAEGARRALVSNNSLDGNSVSVVRVLLTPLRLLKRSETS